MIRQVPPSNANYRHKAVR